MKSSNKLTLWIFIALLLGIALGALLNNSYTAPAKKSYEEAIALVKKETEQAGKKEPVRVEIDKILNDSLMTNREKWEKSASLVAQEKKSSSELKSYQEALSRDEAIHPELQKILDLITLFTDIFLRLIKMIIAPLVFATLVVGVAKLGDLSAVGRIGGKTLLWFICASLLSLLLGCILVNLFKPGEMMSLELPFAGADAGVDKGAMTLKGFVEHIFPKSVFEAMATNEILQIVVFALFFGVATAALEEKGHVIIKALDAVGHVMLKVTTMIMYVAPLAVFAAMTAVVAKKGLGVLSTYALFIGEFYAGLLLLWILLFAAGFLLVRKRVTTLIRRIKEPLLLAFSTASSEAAYPKLLEELERFGCRNRIVSFVLPLGYSFNLDGSMMYMTFASLFIAQSYGIQMSIGDQLIMLLTLMVTSKGIAGVPRASLVVIAGTLATFNIPEEGILLLLGIDHILDMGRSATNVVGNAVAAVGVSKWEKNLE
ncbi:MAG: dicarboxylate/amino acid:cation symporter [Crocinitomicaceae bacterium]|nr:dicarboxylate/amino acid:cation symporter [Crocinitomicaceae bacterium]